MRRLAWCLALTLVAACGEPTPAPPDPASVGAARTVNPAYISRARTALPAGYEAGDLAGRSSPFAFWGLGPRWTAAPAACGALGQPAPPGARTAGWSASGPGGIVYAAVVETATGLDAAVRDECRTWTAAAGHTSARVALADGPAIDAADTVGMVAETTTVVEGGTETHSRAETFSAYVGTHVVLVTVVTDPGAAGPALAPDFASSLVVDAVAAVRAG